MVIANELREHIRDDMSRYPDPRGALLPALRRVQEQEGCISIAAMQELGALFGVPPIEVLELVRFHDRFALEKEGRHRVRVCTSLSCSLLDGRERLRRLAAHLDVAPGATTADGRITLASEECVGACDGAPVVRVDGRPHERLDYDAWVRIVDALE